MNIDRQDLDTSAGIFDIETENWDTFVAGGHLEENGTYRSWTWKEEDAFADHILSLEGSLWAHNGGAFDSKWLIDHALRRKLPIRVVLSGSSAVKVWIGKSLVVCDSFALFKISLADLTKSQSVTKAKLDLPCKCGDSCGGFCSIRRGMPREDLARMLDYLERDCRSLFDAITAFRKYGHRYDLDLCTTVGSSAWRNASRMLSLPENDLEPRDFKFAREGYFGGRVQVFRPVARAGFEVDINAAYPSAIGSVKLPIGRHERTSGQAAVKAFRDGQPGIFRAQVHVPELHIPPLAFRCGSGRIAYPTGTFSGIWSGNDLSYARECGVDVYVREALIWEKERVVFEPWVGKIWGLRHKAEGGKSGPLGTFLKYLANSLTGKLGANPLHDQIEFNPNIRDCRGGARKIGGKWTDERECPEGGRINCHLCCKFHCNFWCGAHRPIFPELGIYARKVWRIEECAHPHWAAYLTADVRNRLHRQLTDDGEGGRTAVYCDTDSVFSTTERTWRISPELGDFEDKGGFRNFEAIAPKVYTYERAGKPTVKAKGVMLPRDEEGAGDVWRKLRAGELVGETRHGIRGFKAGAKGGRFFTAGSRQRRIKAPGFGDRFLVDGEYTRPPTIEECQTLWG